LEKVLDSVELGIRHIPNIGLVQYVQGVSYLKFNVPFQHKYDYIRDEGSGVERYP